MRQRLTTSISLAAAAASRAPLRSGMPMSGLPGRARVYLDHDAGNDDFVALVYLLKHQSRFDLLGATVTPANSWQRAGASATRKILKTFHSGSDVIPVAESTLPGTNSFPDTWRLDSCKIDLLPQLNGFDDDTQVDDEDDFRDQQQRQHRRGASPNIQDESARVSGQQLLAQTLLGADGAVTLIVTGPLTNLAWLLDAHPEASAKIDRVLMMGGAIDVPGNVFAEDAPRCDGSAEWNFFWDPRAAKRVWDSDLEIVLTPLDATETTPITKDMLLRLGKQPRSASAALVATIWALAGGHLLELGKPYFAWDLLTVAQMAHPEMFCATEVVCNVVAEGMSQGRLERTEENPSDRSAGDSSRQIRARPVSVVKPIDPGELMDVIVTELRS